MNFAWNQFGQIAHGLPRVQAICDWVHNNIEYRLLSGRPDLSASEVIERRYGVCRDFAHAAIGLWLASAHSIAASRWSSETVAKLVAESLIA